MFVCGDDGFAVGERGADPAFGGLEAAGELDDDVCVGIEDGTDVAGPARGCGHVFCEGAIFFARYVAIEDVGEFDAGELLRCEQMRDGTAYGAEAEEGYSRGAGSFGRCHLVVNLVGAGAPGFEAGGGLRREELCGGDAARAEWERDFAIEEGVIEADCGGVRGSVAEEDGIAAGPVDGGEAHGAGLA